MSRSRIYSRYHDRLTNYPSLDAFLNSPLRLGINSIEYGPGLSFLDLHIIDRGSETTIFLFHAAVDPDSTTLPIFVGQQLTEDLKANLVFISDPALDRGVPIGWFAGDNSHALQTDLVEVFKHIIHGLGDSKNLIFFGPSAGGFASLYYSKQFPGSLAIVSNPQTDITRYLPEHVNLYKKACWANQELSTCPITYDLVSEYQKDFPNWVVYLQNEDDTFHIENHLNPWKEAVAENNDRYALLFGDWGDGHAPAPLYLLVGILGYAVELDGDWKTLISDEMFSE